MARNVSKLFRQRLMIGEKAPPEGHEFYGNQWTGGGSGGGGGGGSRLAGATVADSTLRWKNEETIRGELTLELPAGTSAADMTPDEVAAFVRGSSGLSVLGARGLNGADMEEVTVQVTDRGGDWLVAQVEITPTAEAAESWQDQMDQEEQWGTYHPGG